MNQNIPFVRGTVQPTPIPESRMPIQPTDPQSFYPWPGSHNYFPPNPGPAQMTQKMPSIPGKLVISDSDITPNDVPMDGRVSIFPKQDYSYIIAKAWNAEGKIDTVVYVPQQPQTTDNAEEIQNGSENQLQEILNRLQNLEDVISNLPKSPGEDSLKTLSETLNSRLDTVDQMLGEIASAKSTSTNLIVPGGK